MNGCRVGALFLSLLLSVPFAALACGSADRPAIARWQLMVTSPGTVAADWIDEQFPAHPDFHDAFLDGLERHIVIAFGINTLSYGTLLFPAVYFLLVPWLAKKIRIPPYRGDAFWMR